MSKTVAVVTGASSGLGKELVKLLLCEQALDEIWCIARNQDKLDGLLREFGSRIVTFSIDLSKPQNVVDFCKTLEERKPRIQYLVNSAGYAKLCTYDDIDIMQSVNMIELNCGGVVAMCLGCIPYMPRGGRIINIASQASFQPLPYQNIYSSTKAFVRNYSRALNVELREKGITVTAVCPGWMNTPDFFARAQIDARKATRRFVSMTTPDKVAAKAMRDAKLGKDISVYSLYVKSAHLAAKLLPQRAMMQIWLWQQGMK